MTIIQTIRNLPNNGRGDNVEPYDHRFIARTAGGTRDPFWFVGDMYIVTDDHDDKVNAYWARL